MNYVHEPINFCYLEVSGNVIGTKFNITHPFKILNLIPGFRSFILKRKYRYRCGFKTYGCEVVDLKRLDYLNSYYVWILEQINGNGLIYYTLQVYESLADLSLNNPLFSEAYHYMDLEYQSLKWLPRETFYLGLESQLNTISEMNTSKENQQEIENLIKNLVIDEIIEEDVKALMESVVETVCTDNSMFLTQQQDYFEEDIHQAKFEEA